MAKNRDTMLVMMIFVGAIIAVVFTAEIANTNSLNTNTFTLNNFSVSPGPATNASVALEGRQFIVGTAFQVWNLSNGTAGNPILLSGGGNATIQTETINGAETVTVHLFQNGSAFTLEELNVTYTFGREGYLTRTADRSIINLVLIFAALGAVVFVLVVLLGKGSTMKELMEKFR